MRHLLANVPLLVQAFGKWPSFIVVLLATPQAASELAFILVLHHLLR